MLEQKNTALLVVDVQQRLWAAMHEKDELERNVVRMVKGSQILGVPVLWTEQNPKGLGPTLPQVAELLNESEPVTKLSFSCCGEPLFLAKLQSLDRKQILVTGIEAHVCVYQTVADLLQMDYEVQVIADAVASRTPQNRDIGLERCRELGAIITSTETVLFELLRKAEGDAFKQMLNVVK